MEGFEITGPYASALLMSLGALCLFIWGVLSGAFHHADEASVRFYEMEMESDAKQGHASTPSKPTSDLELHEARNGGIWRRRHRSAARLYPGMAPGRLLRCFSSGDSTMPTTYWGGLGPGRIHETAPPESREVID